MVCARLFIYILASGWSPVNFRYVTYRRGRGGGGARVLKQFIDLYTERVARGFVRSYVALLSDTRHATYVVSRARERKKGRKRSFAVSNAPNRRENEEEHSALSVDSRHFTIWSIIQLVSVLNYTRFASSEPRQPVFTYHSNSKAPRNLFLFSFPSGITKDKVKVIIIILIFKSANRRKMFE